MQLRVLVLLLQKRICDILTLWFSVQHSLLMKVTFFFPLSIVTTELSGNLSMPKCWKEIFLTFAKYRHFVSFFLWEIHIVVNFDSNIVSVIIRVYKWKYVLAVNGSRPVWFGNCLPEKYHDIPKFWILIPIGMQNAVSAVDMLQLSYPHILVEH